MTTRTGNYAIAKIPSYPATTIKLQAESSILEACIVVSIKQKVTGKPPVTPAIRSRVAIIPVRKLTAATCITNREAVIWFDPKFELKLTLSESWRNDISTIRKSS